MGSGLIGGSGGGIDERIADILVNVFDRYDIEPGELNKNINDTIELVREFAPEIRQLQELTDSMENDVQDMRRDLNSLDRNMDDLGETLDTFNENSDELADQLERVADSMEQFNELIDDAVEADQK
jgi:methyl-accepting chemotaxis protein